MIVERRQQRPMLDLSLFRKPAFAGASIVAFALSGSIFSMFLYLTLYIQDVLGYSPLQAGLRFLPITLLSFFVAPIAGRLSVRVPVRLLLGCGPAARQHRPAGDERGRRQLRLDGPDPRLRARRRRRRADQPAARLDRRRRRPPLAQRHGLGDQQHLPPGRHRDRHRRPRRDLPARRDAQHDRRAVAAEPGAKSLAAAHGKLNTALVSGEVEQIAHSLPHAARGAL